MAPNRKRNPQDLTLRNRRAFDKRVAKLEGQVRAILAILKKLR